VDLPVPAAVSDRAPLSCRLSYSGVVELRS
jgi:hypothetical protein